MERFLGLLAHTFGDQAAAIGHFERAIEINERKEGLLEAAYSRVDLARALLAADASNAMWATELLNEALALADERGDLVRLRQHAEEVRSGA